MADLGDDFAKLLVKRGCVDITPSPTEYQETMIKKLVCLTCLERAGYSEATKLVQWKFSYKCPNSDCESWIPRIHDEQPQTCTCCTQAMAEPTPIARVCVTDGNKKLFKFARLDGSVCVPHTYTPPKSTACMECGDRKGDRFDLRPASNKDPSKAICQPCYDKFRFMFMKAASKELRKYKPTTPADAAASGYLTASAVATKNTAESSGATHTDKNKQRGGGA